MSYLDRYLNGENEAVWRELTALGAAVRQSGLLEDATAVCDELIRRARVNFDILAEALLAEGYRFNDPRGAYSFATPESLARLDRLEREWGQFPLIARRWYETFEYVNFAQDDEQFGERGKLCGFGYDAKLLVFSLEESEVYWEETLQSREWQIANWEGSDGNAYDPGPLTNYLEYQSNRMFELPCEGIDAPVVEKEGVPITFVENFRRLFEDGGFPHLNRSVLYPGYHPLHKLDDPQGLKDRLTRELLPI